MGFNVIDKDIWLVVFKLLIEYLLNVMCIDFFLGYILIYDCFSCVCNCDGYLGYWGLNFWVIVIL